MKRILIIAILFVLGSNLVLAVDVNPNIPGKESPQTPEGIIANIYQFSLMVGGLLAMGAIVYGSLKYILAAGNPSGQGDAKDQIVQALLGLLLLVGAYLILNVLNPDLVTLKLPELEPLCPSGQTYQRAVGPNNTVVYRCSSSASGSF